MDKDRALAWAVLLGTLSGVFVWVASGIGPGTVFGPVWTVALVYLIMARRK